MLVGLPQVTTGVEYNSMKDICVLKGKLFFPQAVLALGLSGASLRVRTRRCSAGFEHGLTRPVFFPLFALRGTRSSFS